MDNENYPVEASATGKNAYMHACDIVQQRVPFAACCIRIQDRKAGRLSKELATCSAAIGKRECPAMAMRQRELDAGKAIYFIDRQKQSGWTPLPPRVQEATSAPKAKRPAGGGTYTDAINQALVQEASKRAEESKRAVTTIRALPENTEGLSPLQIARLRAQNGVSHA